MRSSLDPCTSSKPHPSGSLPPFIHYLLTTSFPSTTGQCAPCSEATKSHNFCGWIKTSSLAMHRSPHTELDAKCCFNGCVQATPETWSFAHRAAAEVQEGSRPSPALQPRPGATAPSPSATGSASSRHPRWGTLRALPSANTPLARAGTAQHRCPARARPGWLCHTGTVAVTC